MKTVYSRKFASVVCSALVASISASAFAQMPALTPASTTTAPTAPSKKLDTEAVSVPQGTEEPSIEAKAASVPDEKASKPGGVPAASGSEEQSNTDTPKMGDDKPAPKGPTSKQATARQAPNISEPQSADEVVNPNSLPFTYHQKHFDLGVGVQLAGMGHDGIQPYSEEPYDAKLVLRAGGAFFSHGKFTTALLGEVSGGKTSAYVRDIYSRLNFVGLSLGVEERLHFDHQFYAYGRVAPGAEYVKGALGRQYDEGDSWPADVEDGNWGFQVDATVGLAFRMFGASDGRLRTPRFWLFVEGGYHYATKHDLALSSDEDEGPPRANSIELGPLSTRGPVLSAGVNLTF